MRDHIMLDIETLALSDRAVIIEIGAVQFDFEEEYEPLDEDHFHVCVDPAAQVELIKSEIDARTVMWWFEQGGWKPSGPLKSLPQALGELRQFGGAKNHGRDWARFEGVWSNHPRFDFSVLRHGYNLMPSCPWTYRQERDCSTLWYAAHRVWQAMVSRAGVEDGPETIMPMPERGPKTHNALSDCIEQILTARHLMRIITHEGPTPRIFA